MTSGRNRQCASERASERARRALANLRRLARRAPRVGRIATAPLVREIAEAERESLDWLDAPKRDPQLWRVWRLAGSLVRLERLLDRVRAWNARWAAKREVLADAGLRGELREALGGEAALERWEAIWEAGGGNAEPERDRCQQSRPASQIVEEAEEVALYPWERGEETFDGTPIETPERVRAGLHADLRARFRLPGVPTGRTTQARRAGRGASCGQGRAVRIAVWPEELRGEVREERRGRPGRRAKRCRPQSWTRGDVTAVERSFRDGVAAKCRGP